MDKKDEIKINSQVTVVDETSPHCCFLGIVTWRDANLARVQGISKNILVPVESLRKD